MSLALAFLIPAYVAFVVAGLGQWLAAGASYRLDARLSWIEQLCLGALLAVSLFAVLGLVVVGVPHEARAVVARVGLLALGIASAACLVRGGWAAMRKAHPSERVFALGFGALCVLAIALALYPARLPAKLVDGPYVAKHDLLGVRVQYTTGNLPTDNAIPHVVSEYLLKDISFREERPLMPGQEVTNRPILAGVIVSAFRAATYLPERQQGELPRFTYVGTRWPDFSMLMRDERGYRVSQAVGVTMNALLLLGLGALACRRRAITPGIAFAAVALYLSSPYFIFQTYFTWPKALAGFFILVAWMATAHWRAPLIAGTALGLAYLSHPYAIAFFGIYLCWHCVTGFLVSRDRAGGEWKRLAWQVGALAGAFAVTTAPWFIWKSLLDIQTNLVAQNLLIPGQGLRDFLWARAMNMATTIIPMHLLGYPFDVDQVVRVSAVNASGAMGLLLMLVLIHRAQVSMPSTRAMVLWGVPAAALIGVFSNPAVPLLHGLQPLVAVLLLVSVVHLWEWAGRKRAAALIAAQVLVNTSLLVFYFRGLL